MARIQVFASLACAAFILTGCQSAGSRLLTGSVSAYAPVGAVASGLAGGQLGRDLSTSDRRTALDAEYQALETGRTGAAVPWRGRSGTRGEVIAGPLYQVNDYDCRDYTHTITMAGNAEVARGTACRRSNGAWQLVS